MENTRKYILNINKTYSQGIGTFSGVTCHCSLLDKFTITYDTIPATSCVYPKIDVPTLQLMSKLDYEKRLIDFLDYVNIDSSITKENLFNEASYDDINCGNLKCNLNEDFLVYKFLTGVRVVNTGIPHGVVQYRIYPNSVVNPSDDDYPWQDSGTFLNLNQNEIYLVEIRDILENNVICSYSKIIAMSLLVQSTTVTLPAKIVRLKELSSSSNGSCKYKTGCIEISSALSQGQKIKLCFDTSADAFYSGGGCVILTCKPFCCNQYVEFFRVTDTTSPKSGEVIINYCDSVCYNLIAKTSVYGSNANSELQLTCVNGESTVVPTIDITKNCATVTNCLSPLNITVTLGTPTITSPNCGVCVASGTINLSSQVPVGETLSLHMLTLNSSVGGTSTTEYYCKPMCSATYYLKCSVTQSNSQPQNIILSASQCDNYCYRTIVSSTCAGTCTNSVICLNDLSSTYGINPIRLSGSTSNCIRTCSSIPATNLSVSMCRLNLIGTQSFGMVLSTPTVPVGQCITIPYIVNQTAIGACVGCACIHLYCKPHCSSTYVNLCTYSINSTNLCQVVNGSMMIKYGDSICYTNYVAGNAGSCSDICLCNGITGTIGVLPTLCATKYRDCVKI